jgi:hypothetical protein
MRRGKKTILRNAETISLNHGQQQLTVIFCGGRYNLLAPLFLPTMEATNQNDATGSLKRRAISPRADSSQRHVDDNRKSSRQDDGGSFHPPLESTAESNLIDGQCSVESLLAVPLEVIFREIGDGSTPKTTTTSAVASLQTTTTMGKPWLTRAEAHCLLRVSMLAHELDVLVRLSEQALSQQQWRRSFRERLIQNSKANQDQHGTTEDCRGIERVAVVHPFLRAVLPILEIQDRFISVGCLEYVQMELDRILLGLEMCAVTLRQSAEQNFTLADNLLDTLDDGLSSPSGAAFNSTNSSGRTLAQEKRKLAELEVELCHRLQSLLHDNCEHTNNNTAVDPAPAESMLSDASSCIGYDRSRNILTDFTLEPMEKVCARILGLPNFSHGNPERTSLLAVAAPAAIATQKRVLFPPSVAGQEEDVDGTLSCSPPPPKPGTPSSDNSSHDEEHLCNNDNSFQLLSPPIESQNSYMQKAKAAEALAVLAFAN